MNKPLKFFLTKIYGKSFLSKEILRLIRDGGCSVSGIHEIYEAKLAKCKVVRLTECDLSNGSEAKYRTLVKVRDKYWCAALYPTATKMKTGNIMLAVHNVLTNTIDRFNIPNAKKTKEGYTPGKTVYITYSLKSKDYGKYQKYLISSEQL